MSGDSRKVSTIRARLSLSGWIYVLLTMVLGLAAVNSNNNVLFLLTSLLLSLLFLSGLTALYNVSGLSIKANSSKVPTAQRQNLIQISIKNNKRLASIVLDVGLEDHTQVIPVLNSKASSEVFLPWTPWHRGKVSLPYVKVTSSFPFGFVVRGGYYDARAVIVVSPAPDNDLMEQVFAKNEKQSETLNTGQGLGEWKGIRQYRPGESMSSIVWRRLDWQKPAMGADNSQWPAHSFAHEASKALVLDWDDPVYQHLDTEKRLSLFRTLLDEMVLSNTSWKLNLPAVEISGSGKLNLEQALWSLALVEPLPVHNSEL
ncbi:hypothetical protein [Desulfonatronovibrio magnus]|uniref:hypothetical protein n=1 Tax=Desulfonatronovibrio magnus TaxID=698827 RepID=UPI0005EBAA3F|nr:hypothetical protein [Desulfonatronovibrio magnus]